METSFPGCTWEVPRRVTEDLHRSLFPVQLCARLTKRIDFDARGSEAIPLSFPTRILSAPIKI